MAQQKRELFSNVDAAWLHMETPTNMAMITGVMMFDERIDYQRLQKTLESRLLPYERFHQKVREPARGIGLPHWEEDPKFDMAYHLQKVRLPEPAGLEALQTLVGELMSTPLDFSRPLWQYHYVENFGQGSAVIARLHHCIADGLALIQVLLSMTDDCPDVPCVEIEPEPEHELRPLARLLVPALLATRHVRRTVKTTIRTAETLLHEGMEFIARPSKVIDIAKLSTGSTRALGKLLLIGPDPKTFFKGKCDVTKKAAWSEQIPLDDIKSIGRLMGGTVNDVLLSALTGALRRYLEGRGGSVEGLNIRAVVPVSLRPPGDVDKLGNRFGLVFLSLPIGIRDPLNRLVALKRRMDAIKRSPEALVAFGILNAIGMTPKQIEKIVITIFGMKGTAVMTNVPGPREPIYLAGARMSNLMFWVPQPGNLGLGVSIISYAGGVILGIASDAGLVPDPETIACYFNEEVQYLKRWGRRSETNRVSSVVVEEQQVEEVQAVLSMNGRCQATTKSGLPCKNKALPGSHQCRVHSEIA
jgi:WS/DGAT/MGAT family acyltransferase